MFNRNERFVGAHTMNELMVNISLERIRSAGGSSSYLNEPTEK